MSPAVTPGADPPHGEAPAGIHRDVDEYAVLAQIYDLWSADMSDDIPFYVSEAVASGGPVLEVGVGTGRVASAIARAGVDVVGIDVSPSMLSRGRERLAASGLSDRVELFEADMRAFDLGRTFPLAVLPYRVFSHALTVGDQLATLRCLRAHLPPGGRLVLNIPVPGGREDVGRRGLLQREGRFPLEDGREAVLFRQTDVEPATQLVRFHFVVDELDADGSVLRRVHGDTTVRLCSPGELEHALARAGFRVRERYGWFDRRPFDADAPEFVCVAVREDSWQSNRGQGAAS